MTDALKVEAALRRYGEAIRARLAVRPVPPSRRDYATRSTFERGRARWFARCDRAGAEEADARRAVMKLAIELSASR